MTVDLTPDCQACAALCCLALAFDEGEDFAIDKPAGLPCPNLAGHACAIYGSLDRDGFSGCVRYDCQGAGQRTVALHGGVSWRDDPDLTVPMQETFRHLRWIHQQIDLLETAGALPLEDDEEAARRALLDRLCDAEMTPDDAAKAAAGPMRARVAAFLHGLAHHI